MSVTWTVQLVGTRKQFVSGRSYADSVPASLYPVGTEARLNTSTACTLYEVVRIEASTNAWQQETVDTTFGAFYAADQQPGDTLEVLVAAAPTTPSPTDVEGASTGRSTVI